MENKDFIKERTASYENKAEVEIQAYKADDRVWTHFKEPIKIKLQELEHFRRYISAVVNAKHILFVYESKY